MKSDLELDSLLIKSKKSRSMSHQSLENAQDIRDVKYWRKQVISLVNANQPDRLHELPKEINQQDCQMLQHVLNINNDECPLRCASYLETHGCYEVLLQVHPHDKAILRPQLYCSILNGQSNRVRLLLKYGADPTYRISSYSETTFHAILEMRPDWEQTRREEIYQAFEVLLDHPGLNLNQSNSYGHTPLMLSIWASDPRCVRMFLDRGVDLSIMYNSRDAIGLARERLAQSLSDDALKDVQAVICLIENETLKRQWKRVFGEVKCDLRTRGLVDDLFGMVDSYLVY